MEFEVKIYQVIDENDEVLIYDFISSPVASNEDDAMEEAMLDLMQEREIFCPRPNSSCRFEVTPAEPKVLTDEELFEKRLKKNGQCVDNFSERDLLACRAWYLSGVYDSHKNGRLERDLELGPVVKAAQNYVMSNDGTEEYIALKDALLNLPPLTKND